MRAEGINEPVQIPDLPGKISFKKKKDSEYVQYLTDRTYDPIRKYNLPERKIIGIRIPSIPEMMLPNENYYEYFSGDRRMNEEQKRTAAATPALRNALSCCGSCLIRCTTNFSCNPGESRMNRSIHTRP